MKNMTRMFIALTCVLIPGVLGLGSAHAADLVVSSGDLVLDAGFAVTIGGEQAVTIGGSLDQSAWVGKDAGNGQSNATGVGWAALENNTGTFATALGAFAMRGNTGNSSTGFGVNALSNNSGLSCAGFGAEALRRNDGARCIGFGTLALKDNEGADCIGLGFNTLTSNTGQFVVAIGSGAGQGNTKSAVILLGLNVNATANSQMVIGSDSGFGTIKDLHIGRGVNAVTPDNVTIHATNSSGGSDGADLILTGGTSVSGTAGRVIAINELSTPVLEITGGLDLAEAFPVRDAASTDRSEMVALLLNHGATQ